MKFTNSSCIEVFNEIVSESVHRCEPFPTYPRTYDLLHARSLLSYLSSEKCSIMDLLLEMDRILRPEVIFVSAPFVSHMLEF